MARLLQALAAAAMAPQALASVHALFPPRERGRALSIYGITLGLSSALGQLLGGALVAADIGGLSWRLIFLINVPIVVVAFIATLRVLQGDAQRNAVRGLDWGGVVLSCAALTAFVAAAGRRARARLAAVVDRYAADHADLRRMVPALRNPAGQGGRRSAHRS